MTQKKNRLWKILKIINKINQHLKVARNQTFLNNNTFNRKKSENTFIKFRNFPGFLAIK